MSLLGEVISDAEVKEAGKPRPIFAEAEYPFVVKAAGDDVDDEADPETGLLEKERVFQAPFVLEFTNPATGETTEVFDWPNIRSKSDDAKKRVQIKQMAARFFGSLGLPADAINSITSVKQLVGLRGTAALAIEKNNKGRDRNAVAYYVNQLAA